VIAGGKPGETYVIGGENEKRNIDIVKAICSAVDETLGRSPGTSAKLINPSRTGSGMTGAMRSTRQRYEPSWDGNRKRPSRIR